VQVIAVLVLLFILCLVGPSAIARVSQPPQKKEDKQTQKKEVTSLADLVEDTLAFHFGDPTVPFYSLKDLAASYSVPDNFKKPAGVFVTLSRNGKTRACWGSITPEYPNLVSATIYTTEAALNKEYRFPKIKRGEYQLLKPPVTVVRDIRPLESIHQQNPMVFGLMVRAGGKAAVILPGEARDAYYQMVLCKLKAGIKPKQPCQMYRIKADVFKRS
jgi:AMMECR1 domain-containing protein